MIELKDLPRQGTTSTDFDRRRLDYALKLYKNMKTVADYLKNAPKGIKLYSPICGECTFNYIDKEEVIHALYDDNFPIAFTKYGQFNIDGFDGECLLFPSKEVRTWEGYQIPSPHCDFKPFDKIVCRYENHIWIADMFSHYAIEDDYPYTGLGGAGYSECLPYNEETAKLIGTTDDYKE